MVKSGLEKIFLKFLRVGDYFPLLHKSAQNHKFSNKNNYLPTWRVFKINFSRPLFTIIFRPKMVFLVTDSILMVKPMYESVKLDVLRCIERANSWNSIRHNRKFLIVNKLLVWSWCSVCTRSTTTGLPCTLECQRQLFRFSWEEITDKNQNCKLPYASHHNLLLNTNRYIRTEFCEKASLKTKKWSSKSG